MSKLRYLGIFLLLLLNGALASAQVSSIRAMIDSSSIRIGQQAQIRLTVVSARGENIVLPDIKAGDTLTSGIEVLRVSASEPKEENDSKRWICDFLITSFQPGEYIIPPFFVHSSVSGTRFQSNELSFTVTDISEPIRDNEFNDIRTVIEPPFDWWRILKWMGLVAVIEILVVCAIIYYLKHRKKAAEQPVVIESNVPKLKPNEVALMALERIKSEKVWHNGLFKEYYTQLTDVIRKYIEDGFGVTTMEKTSTEILDAIKYKDAMIPIMDKLRQMFSVADVVKFARYEPTNDECEISLLNAFGVVNETVSFLKHREMEDVETKSQTEAKDEMVHSDTDNLNNSLSQLEKKSN